MQLLEARRRELAPQDAAARPRPESEVVQSVDIISRPETVPEAERPVPVVSSRRARWFQAQFPQIILEDGSRQTLRSLEELRELLRARGLTPHPRGDASMLLWQVRNRLRLAVEPVPADSLE